MKRQQEIRKLAVTTLAVFVSVGIWHSIGQLADNSMMRFPASEGESATTAEQATAQETLNLILAKWVPDATVTFELELKSKAQAIIQKYREPSDTLAIEIKQQDLKKAEKLKLQATELKAQFDQDFSSLQEFSKKLELDQIESDKIAEELKSQITSAQPEQLVAIQTDLKRIEEFKKQSIDQQIVSELTKFQEQLLESLAQIEIMEKQIAQEQENQKLQIEVDKNQAELKKIREELVQLKCEKERETKIHPIEDKEEFIEDINASAQMLALLDRSSLGLNLGGLPFDLSNIYSQYGLLNNPNLYSSNSNLYGAFFQLQNQMLMNNWFSSAFQSPQLYSNYGLFNGQQTNTTTSPMGSWGGFNGNNNIVNYNMYSPQTGDMGFMQGRGPSGMQQQIPQSPLWRTDGFSGAGQQQGGSSAPMGFKF